MRHALPIVNEGNDLNESLRENVRLLGDLLGTSISAERGESFLATIEQIRHLAKETHRDDSRQGMQALIDYLHQLSDEDLLPVTRAFNQFLNLSNIAEQHYKASLHYVDDYRPNRQPERLPQLFERLTSQGDADAARLRETLETMRVELVLTAHPTEVVRRTLIHKYDEVDDCLEQIADARHYPEKRSRLYERLADLISQVWRTNEIRHTRPTPVDEARWGFAVIEHSLWQALPDFYRNLDAQLLAVGQSRLSLEAAPLRFASWMGGDRDGNPNVTAKVTRRALLHARYVAARLHLRDLEALRVELSMWQASSELSEQVGEVAEPYRALLVPIIDQLKATCSVMMARLKGEQWSDKEPVIERREQLFEPLALCYRSLIECGMHSIANGALLDSLRRVASFGVTLVKLDIRQESGRHREVMTELVRDLFGEDYEEWSEQQREQFLIRELASRRPLLPRNWQCSDSVREVLDTFEAIASSTPEALGSYVISMASSASDILTVALLMKESGSVRLPVAPLFETLDDLDGAGEVIDHLLSLPIYRELIGDRQEVMIGYSDSAKDAGQLAASWAQYRAQEQLTEVCQRHGVDLTLFHGRGGTVGRGGGPVHAAILSQPPGSVKGSLRVTEQGEMIRFKFGQPSIAARTMEIYVGAVLEATLTPPPVPKPEWREEMDRLATIAHSAYVDTVRNTPEFVSYFRQATPETALGRLALGSRPAKRNSAGGVESLRAIPWIFAWTQTRLMLPAWLGTDAAFAERWNDSDGQRIISEMREQWPFFATYIDLLEMLLAKSDATISHYYEQRLVNEPELEQLGAGLRERLSTLVDQLLVISGQEVLLEHSPLIRQAIAVRNPYIDPLHALQAELLRRTREAEGDIPDSLERALMVTMAGIAAGLRNTG
ncbi:phosphoenolpyruvate carboxylase [Carnimonas nigrificans]|uniref:phosphoenolpyruvate carboxylase n=1 Tax=Carnimonas nigrificans TaxID=64323 RepID=UPI0004BAEF4F|nr:phosphoenolpyruvate carboxylase [Carnimonas nigrificans]